MARLVPEDYPVETIPHRTERQAVEALMALPDSWFIIPNLRLLRNNVERELDIVLLHPSRGVVLIEVKGWIPEVRGGLWFDELDRVQESPFNQAISNSFNLCGRIWDIVGKHALSKVPCAVAFPRAAEFTGVLPHDRDPWQVILGTDLADADLLDEKVVELASSTYLVNGFGVDAVNAIINELAPDAHFTWDADGEQRRARNMLRSLSNQQVEGFASLDANKRVFVRGRAGTGKTRLARAWVRRAVADRDERVLLTCYNDPLGWSFRDDFDGMDGVTAAPFLQLLCGYAGVDGPGADDDSDVWWNETLPELAMASLADLDVGFDTIVIDEAQDFAPRWLEIATRLLDPAGPQRVLLLGDEAQDIYGRGFVAPEADDGWVHAEMPRNCRNAEVIATLLRRRLDGARPSPAAPPGWQCQFITADDADAVSSTVGKLLGDLVGSQGRHPSSIGVVSTGAMLRNRLGDDHGLVRDPDGESTLVGTPHRLKGLEFDTVILVSDEPHPSDVKLYIGVSRAVSELIVVGPVEIADRLGLESSSV